MKIEIRPRNRRALLGMGIALILYLALDRLVFPVWDGLSQAEEIVASKEDQLRRYRRALVRQARYGDLEQTVVAQTADLERLVIQAENESLASVELQSVVDTLFSSAGLVAIQRTIVGERELDDFYSETAMTLVFECSPSQLMFLLSEFRNSGTFLNVRSLQVIPTELATGPADGQILSKGLRATLTVAALMRI